MAWVLLVLAGFLEVGWAFSMKQSEGFTKLGYSSLTVIGIATSLFLLAIAMRTIPLGTAYTIWTGIGAVGAFLLGILVLGEAVAPLRLLAAVLIISGLILMKLSSS